MYQSMVLIELQELLERDKNRMTEQTEKKQFYRTVLALLVPMALQNLINVGISSVDVIMLGRVGEKVLSGASLGSQVQFIMSLVLFGLTSGASVLIAQYWGKGDKDSIATVFGIAMKTAALVGIFFAIVTECMPKRIMTLFTNDTEVILQGIEYLRIVAISYAISAITMVYLNTMRGMERVAIATVTYLTSMIVNIVVNGLLIFGLFSFPKMGIAGAAIGTLLARMVELLVVLFYNWKKNDVLPFRISFLFRKNSLLFRDFVKYSIPVVFNELMWGAGVSTIAAILGHMGSSAVAANSVAQVVRQLATVVAFGVASTTAILIGKAIGEGKLDIAKEYGKRFRRLGIITGIAGAIVVLLARPIVLEAFTLSVESRYYLGIMMLVMSYFVVGQSYNTTLIVGIFRGGGDTLFGLILDVSVMWGISIAFGALGAFFFDFSVPLVYIILLSDEVIKIPITTWRYRTYRWLQNVTR